VSNAAAPLPPLLAARLGAHANLARLVAGVLAAWPEHAAFLDKRFAVGGAADRAHEDALASLVLQLCGTHLARACADYRSLCTHLLAEELYFRRHDRYRVASAAQATAELYGAGAFMAAYMNGLLLSQPLWANHAGASRFFVADFLPANPVDYRHLEIGPGHGLLLSFAAGDPLCAAAVGWDVSATSLTMTADALHRLGLARRVRLEARSVLDAGAGDGAFDSIAISEVLEHLDTPLAALEHVRELLRPGGRVFINMPVNSPAPDHVYLLRTPEAVLDLVRAAGLTVDGSRLFPASGYDEARARRHRVTISVVAIARRAP